MSKQISDAELLAEYHKLQKSSAWLDFINLLSTAEREIIDKMINETTEPKINSEVYVRVLGGNVQALRRISVIVSMRMQELQNNIETQR